MPSWFDCNMATMNPTASAISVCATVESRACRGPRAMMQPRATVEPLATVEPHTDRGNQILSDIVAPLLNEQTKTLNRILSLHISDMKKADLTLYSRLTAIDDRLTKIEAAMLRFDKNINLLVQRSEKKFVAGVRIVEPGPAKNMFDKTDQIDLDHD